MQLDQRRVADGGRETVLDIHAFLRSAFESDAGGRGAVLYTRDETFWGATYSIEVLTHDDNS